MKKSKLVLCFFVALACGACANSDANLKRESARVIGGLSPEDITVTEVNRGMMNVDWKANTQKGVYNCSSDDMMRRPFCVKK